MHCCASKLEVHNLPAHAYVSACLNISSQPPATMSACGQLPANYVFVGDVTTANVPTQNRNKAADCSTSARMLSEAPQQHNLRTCTWTLLISPWAKGRVQAPKALFLIQIYTSLLQQKCWFEQSQAWFRSAHACSN